MEKHWRSIDEYKKRSAIYWPETIEAPILIIHGEKDSNVSVNQAENFAIRLKKAGKIYKLSIFRGDDQWVSIHRKERNQLILDWFRRYLQ